MAEHAPRSPGLPPHGVELPEVLPGVRGTVLQGGVSVLHDVPGFAATSEEINAARRRHCDGSDNEIEIDEPTLVSRGDDGCWVQAWVWVPAES